MYAIATLLPIFGFALFISVYFNKLASVALFFSISFIITILYFFGLANLLQESAYLVFYGGAFLLIVLFLKNMEQAKRFFLRIPTILLIIGSLIFIYFMHNAHLFFWDEYSHWGNFAKYLYYNHEFYDTHSTAAHLRYPPGISIWDYFFVFQTEFLEGNLYFAYFVLLFSATSMIYEKISWKQPHYIITAFGIQILLFATYGHWFSSIYVDHVIGAMFAGLILSFIAEQYNTKKLWLYIFPLLAITLIKEIGLFFAVSFMGFVIVMSFLNQAKEHQQSIWAFLKSKNFIIPCLLAIVTFTTLQSWSIRQDIKGVPKESQTISGIAKGIFSKQKDLDNTTINTIKKRFLEVAIDQQLHKEKLSLNYNEFSYPIMKKYTKKIKLSTLGSAIFFLILSLFALGLLAHDKNRLRIIIVSGYLLFSTIAYFFILYFSYQVAFGAYGLKIPSYVRYINTAILPLFFVGFAFFLPLFGLKSKNRFIVLVLTIGLFTFITKPYFKPLYSQLNNGFRVIETQSRQIVKTIPKNSKLFVIFPIPNNGNLNNILKYNLVPIQATISGKDFFLSSQKEQLRTYKNYDYVWLYDINRLRQQNTIPTNKDKLFKVLHKNNAIQLQPIKLDA